MSELESPTVEAADRLALEIARADGGLVDIEIWREGVEDPAGEALAAHCRDMCRRGYLQYAGRFGSKARMQGARLVARYQATEAGETVLALLQRLERA